MIDNIINSWFHRKTYLVRLFHAHTYTSYAPCTCPADVVCSKSKKPWTRSPTDLSRRVSVRHIFNCRRHLHLLISVLNETLTEQLLYFFSLVDDLIIQYHTPGFPLSWTSYFQGLLTSIFLIMGCSQSKLTICGKGDPAGKSSKKSAGGKAVAKGASETRLTFSLYLMTYV